MAVMSQFGSDEILLRALSARNSAAPPQSIHCIAEANAVIEVAFSNSKAMNLHSAGQSHHEVKPVLRFKSKFSVTDCA